MLDLVLVIGPILAATSAVTIAAFQSVALVAAVLVVMIAAQQLESAVLLPASG